MAKLFPKSLKFVFLGFAFWLISPSWACTSSIGAGVTPSPTTPPGEISNAAVPSTPPTVASPEADPTKKMPYVFIRKWGVIHLGIPENPTNNNTITGNLALTSDPFDGLGSGQILRAINLSNQTFFEFELEKMEGIEGSFVLKIVSEGIPSLSFYMKDSNDPFDPAMSHVEQPCPSQGSCAPLNGKKLSVKGEEENSSGIKIAYIPQDSQITVLASDQDDE